MESNGRASEYLLVDIPDGFIVGESDDEGSLLVVCEAYILEARDEGQIVGPLVIYKRHALLET